MVKKATFSDNESLKGTNPDMPVEWHVESGSIPYQDALDKMEAEVLEIRAGQLPEKVWLLQHPPVYTAGTSAKSKDLLAAQRFPVITTNRGGQFTYHGPGQRVAYVMLNLKNRKPDVRLFVNSLEGWLIDTLAHFGIKGERRDGRVGVWVRRSDGSHVSEEKIAAVGVRVRHWVTFHGISLNVNPDLEHFSGIVPCGIRDYGVTSLHAMGRKVTMDEVDRVLLSTFPNYFGPVAPVEQIAEHQSAGG